MKRAMMVTAIAGTLLLTATAGATPPTGQTQQGTAAVQADGAQASGGSGAAASEGDASASDGESAEAGVSEEAGAEGEGEDDRLLPFTTSVSLGGGFGAATILSKSEYTQTDYFESSVGLSLSYAPIEELRLGASIGYSKFLTDNGGSVFQREGRLSDLSLSAGWAGWEEENTGIRIGASANASLPTSDFSQFERRYLALGTGINISKNFGGLGLSYNLGVRKNFHAYTSLVADPNTIDIVARKDQVEVIGADLVALPEGVLGEWYIINSFSLGFGFFEIFSAGLSLSYADVWTYDNGTITKDDQYVNEYAVVGRGHSQSVSGGLSLAAQINDYVGVDVGVSTGGAPLTSDNKSLRFPFWDFENGQAARTSVGFGVSASY